MTEKNIKVVIGTPVNTERAYILDKFLDNQRQIQQGYGDCELVMTTSEKDFVPKIKNMMDAACLRGKVLTHNTIKPEYARHWVWDVASGREAIRQYSAEQTEADYLLFLDADMIFDTQVVSTMIKFMGNNGAIFNGCALRKHGYGLGGAGCLMLKRGVFERIHFRCEEFRNGEIIFEDNLLEMDMFRLHAHVRKGFFVANDHFQDVNNFKHTEPHRVGLFQMFVNIPLIRYVLIRSSVVLHYNIPWRIKLMLEKTDERTGIR